MRRRRRRAATEGDLPAAAALALRAVADLRDHAAAGLDGTAAATLAEGVRRALLVRGAVVTDLDRVLARSGPVPDDTVVLEGAREALERRRWRRPVLSRAPTDGEDTAVAVVVLAVEDVPVGTLHVVDSELPAVLVDALAAFGELAGDQLLLAELAAQRERVAASELRALRAEVSPHFIHNALTAIAGLVHTDPHRARDLLSTFAEFLRSSFRRDEEMITLAEELRLVEIYLDLERARFGEHFEVSLRVAPEVLGVRLPALSVQPLVENAIRHGLEPRDPGGRLVIVAADAQAEARIDIEDDGVGTDPQALQDALLGRRASRHLGVLVVDERLRSTFGPEYGLVIRTAERRGTHVSMRIPKFAGGP